MARLSYINKLAKTLGISECQLHCKDDYIFIEDVGINDSKCMFTYSDGNLEVYVAGAKIFDEHEYDNGDKLFKRAYLLVEWMDKNLWSKQS